LLAAPNLRLVASELRNNGSSYGRDPAIRPSFTMAGLRPGHPAGGADAPPKRSTCGAEGGTAARPNSARCL